jgi:hypothetical protein
MLLSENLTIPGLAHELTMWRKNPEHLRFGQRIWGLYGNQDLNWPELYNEWNELEAYSLVLALLYGRLGKS